MRAHPTGWALTLGLLAACAPEREPEREPEPAAPVLAQPRVDMQADPPPPHTYWAPEGATIRNHPAQPGVWVAEVNGRPGPFYFGDACQAARRQGWIGQDVAALRPDIPPGARVSAQDQAVTSDLGFERLNVVLDQPDGRVVRVACG